MKLNFLKWLDSERKSNHNALIKAPPPSPKTKKRREFKARGSVITGKLYYCLPDGSVHRRMSKPWRNKSERRQVLKQQRAMTFEVDLTKP